MALCQIVMELRLCMKKMCLLRDIQERQNITHIFGRMNYGHQDTEKAIPTALMKKSSIQKGIEKKYLRVIIHLQDGMLT